MASDYGLNFGFRRSDEAFAIREGRFKAPATGPALLIGSAVEIDGANEGYLKQCADGAVAQAGPRGLLVQEENHFGTVFEAAPFLGHDSLDLGLAKIGAPSVMWAGAGTKVWFKNTPAYQRGERSKAAVTMVDLTGVNVGDLLGWDGSKWVKKTGDAGWLTVTHIKGADYCEAVLTF